MMKTLRNALVVLGFAAMFVASPAAHAVGLSTSLVGGLNQTIVDGGATGWTAGVRLGVGAGILDVDASAMFLSRGVELFDNLNYIEIPIMIRYPLLPAISLGAGGFYDVAVTDGIANRYGLRGGLQISPIGLPVFLEGNYNHSLGEGPSGAVKDLQVLVGLHF